MRKKVIEINDLNVKIDKTEILKNVSLSVNEGEVVGLLGPNGAGKTTLMKAVCGLVKSNSGTIHILDYNVGNKCCDALGMVGVLIEDTCAYEKLSGLENLKILARMYGSCDEKQIEEIVDIIGLNDSINNAFKTYSLGMKKRLGIGMALINNPKILILDEPSNGLDIEGQHEITALIKKLAVEKNMSIIISSHITGQLEKVCQSVVFVKKGKIIGTVRLDEVQKKTLEEYYLEKMGVKDEQVIN